MGFGADRRMHTSKIVELSENLPVIIEIIDKEDNISRLMPFLDKNLCDGFLTMERVKVIEYRRTMRKKNAPLP